MQRILLTTFCAIICTTYLYSQDVPNVSNATLGSSPTEEAGKLSSVPVNMFTGMPVVSVPLYSYNNSASGLRLDISADYFTGGTQVAEAPGTIGLNWSLTAGGCIYRTVRGMPDDIVNTGYMYTPAIPTDFRSKGDKYYFDSLDTQQDVFQFSFCGRSGKFFIGKDGKIIVVPSTKIRVIPFIFQGNPYNKTIVAFRIITEDNVKYDFATTESESISPTAGSFTTGYANYSYNTSWYLSDIISAFNTDTIKFTYTSINESPTEAYPQIAFVRNSDAVRTSTYSPTALDFYNSVKISAINFPDKKNITFVYSNVFLYNNGDYALSKVKIGDSVFRYGYQLDYVNSYPSTGNCRLQLTGITPYTSLEKKTGYIFAYNTPYFTPLGSGTDTIQNQRDYWGFWNGGHNPNGMIPAVDGFTGANRNPNASYAVASTLSTMTLPGGGTVLYQYELNDHYPTTLDPHTLTISGATSTQNNVTFSQVFNSKCWLTFNLDYTVSRQGSAPITGSGTVTCNLKSTDGSILYATYTFSLYDLFSLGSKTWAFNLPNGTYMLQTVLSGGTVVTGSFPIDVVWENKLLDNTHLSTPAGGLRIKRITRQDAIDDTNKAVIEDYVYTTPDGKSSGFLGDIPQYAYPFYGTVIYGGTRTTAYTAISSDPLNTLNYTEGSPVGYSMVTVYRGSSTHNIGKSVYEYTNFQDVNSNHPSDVFPYTPQQIRDWGFGLPKRISIYDSTGRLVKRTVNTYGIDTTLYQDTSYKSLMLGNSATTYSGDSSQTATPRTRTYVGQEYYPESGRIYLTYSVDSLYQTDGSINTVYKNITYDTNYNVTKITSNYDRTRGLQMETRMYYPYNYSLSGPIGIMRDSGLISSVIAIEKWITGDANPRMNAGQIFNYFQLPSGQIVIDTLYELQSNAPVPQTTIGVFDGTKLNRQSSYFVPQVSYLTYDKKGNLLESKNIVTGISSVTLMDYNNEYPIASVENSALSDVAYTSFESDSSGRWTIASPMRDYSGALTGKLCYNLSNGNVTKSGLNASQTYILSFWARTTASVAVNGTTASSPVAQQGGWNLYLQTLTSITSITISGSGQIDELRLHPKTANMTTYTYEPMIGITTVADPSNTVAYKVYDHLNRLKLVLDKDNNIIQRYDYSDTVMSISTMPLWYNNGVTQWEAGTCIIDSQYVDNNPYSDTYQATEWVSKGANYCACSQSASYPMYKMVNGACQLGTRTNVSTAYVKVLVNGSWVYEWECVYYYTWSDGSQSQNYTEYDSSACPLGSQGGN